MPRKIRTWDGEDVIGPWRKWRVTSWLRRNSKKIKRHERRQERHEAKADLRKESL